jgi:hypothetical protein
MSHDADHETLLDALSEGTRTEDDAEARAVLASCATCRRAWEAERELMDALRQGKVERDEVLQSARDVAAGPAGDRVEEAMRARIARQAATTAAVPGPEAMRTIGGVRARKRWPIFALAAAAAVIFAFFTVFVRGVREDDSDKMYAGDGPKVEAIETLPDGGLRLRWEGAIPPKAKVEAIIEGRRAAGEPWERLVRQSISGSEWIAPVQTVAGWPDELRWRIVVLDSTGGPHSESAWSGSFSSR